MIPKTTTKVKTEAEASRLVSVVKKKLYKYYIALFRHNPLPSQTYNDDGSIRCNLEGPKMWQK